MKTVTLKEANQNFSKLIRELESAGESFVITRQGRPVARLLPHAADRTADPEWQAAHDRLKALLEEGLPLGGLKVDRDELYDR